MEFQARNRFHGETFAEFGSYSFSRDSECRLIAGKSQAISVKRPHLSSATQDDELF
jgi:hypothetical protein